MRTPKEGRSLRTLCGYLLLVVPVLGLVVPPLYARSDPHVFGMPFVVWYQFILVLAGCAVTGVAFLTRSAHQRLAEQPLADAPNEN